MIFHLFQRLHQLKEEIMALNTDALKTAIDALKVQAASANALQTQLTQAQADLAAAQSQIDALTTDATSTVVAADAPPSGGGPGEEQH
jgi:hypothetical protein